MGACIAKYVKKTPNDFLLKSRIVAGCVEQTMGRQRPRSRSCDARDPSEQRTPAAFAGVAAARRATGLGDDALHGAVDDEQLGPHARQAIAAARPNELCAECRAPNPDWCTYVW